MFGKALQAANSTNAERLPSFSARSGELRLGQRVVRLEPRSAAILEQLRAAEGDIVTRQELLDAGWGAEGGSDEALTQAVAQVRRAFEQLGIHDAIETLAKRGYRLKARFAGQRNIADPERSTFGTSVLIGALVIATVLAISFAHPVRHAVRHALGLGPPSQSSSSQDS